MPVTEAFLPTVRKDLSTKGVHPSQLQTKLHARVLH